MIDWCMGVCDNLKNKTEEVLVRHESQGWDTKSKIRRPSSIDVNFERQT